MSIGENWKRRLETARTQRRQATAAAQARAAEQRASEVIAQLQRKLEKRMEKDCLVMVLEESESTVDFDRLRNEMYTSSELFRGAAKTVVDWCLENGLDVYVWEHDFKMSRGSIGAEIWVTPKGVPYHHDPEQ